METSDSECFESADEDFESDTETVKSESKIVTNKTPAEKTLQTTVLKVKKNPDNTTLTEDQSETNANNNKVENVSKTEVTENDNENNITCQISENLQEEQNTAKEEPIDNAVKRLDNFSIGKQNIKKNDEENFWDDSEISWGVEKEEENMWDDNDDWEPIEDTKKESIPEKQEETASTLNASWGSWGNWGVSSIISTATQSVSTFTQGITNVLETGIGVPEPEELARINREEKEKLKQAAPPESDDKSMSFGLGNLVMGVSHFTKLVETTGTKVISGGLDTLETIGKKTMEVLQEGDPGLKKKRAFLTIDSDKPVLSQLLREAKQKSEEENKILEDKHFAKKAKNYEILFDDHQGLVHLEALEMLSKQCDIKLQTLLESYTDQALVDMQETMDQVKELCELPDEDEDEHCNLTEIHEKLNSAVSEINIPISYEKLINTWSETETWLNNLKLEVCDARELHQQAIETLAQLTAIAVEQFHKSGELLLVKDHRSTADEADSLVQLTTNLTSLIGLVAAKFSEKLNAKSSQSKNKDEVNTLITNVFFEAANSSSYIQDAFQLLIPVLQVGAV